MCGQQVNTRLAHACAHVRGGAGDAPTTRCNPLSEEPVGGEGGCCVLGGGVTSVPAEHSDQDQAPPLNVHWEGHGGWCKLHQPSPILSRPLGGAAGGDWGWCPPPPSHACGGAAPTGGFVSGIFERRAPRGQAWVENNPGAPAPLGCPYTGRGGGTGDGGTPR